MSEPGLYVHIPFCSAICPYCDFAVVAARSLLAEREQDYVSALVAELAARRDDDPGSRLASIYLGGGTPSLLTPDSVGRLIEFLTPIRERDRAQVAAHMGKLR